MRSCLKQAAMALFALMLCVSGRAAFAQASVESPTGEEKARSARANAAVLARRRADSVAAFAAVGFPVAQARDFVTTLDNDVVLSMFEAEPDKVLAKVRAPVLAIFGSQDTVLAPELIPNAVAALEGNLDAAVVTIPGMTHELQRAKPVPGAPPVKDSTMPTVTALLGTWLRVRLRAIPAGR